MSRREYQDFVKYLDEDKKEVDALMKRAEEASRRFDQKVKEILQHC